MILQLEGLVLYALEIGSVPMQKSKMIYVYGNACMFPVNFVKIHTKSTQSNVHYLKFKEKYTRNCKLKVESHSSCSQEKFELYTRIQIDQ